MLNPQTLGEIVVQILAYLALDILIAVCYYIYRQGGQPGTKGGSRT